MQRMGSCEIAVDGAAEYDDPSRRGDIIEVRNRVLSLQRCDKKDSHRRERADAESNPTDGGRRSPEALMPREHQAGPEDRYRDQQQRRLQKEPADLRGDKEHESSRGCH